MLAVKRIQAAAISSRNTCGAAVCSSADNNSLSRKKADTRQQATANKL